MSTSKTVRGSDAHNFSVVRSAELTARVAQDCHLNKADAKDLSAHSSTLTDAEALELSSLEATLRKMVTNEDLNVNCGSIHRSSQS